MKKCHNCKTTLEQSAGNTFYCPTCKAYYFIEPDQTELQRSLDSRDAVILYLTSYIKKIQYQKGATMKISTRILGKQRELSGSYTAGQIANGLFFLTNPKDMSETGIYSGETIENWADKAYLKRIRAHQQMIFFNDKKKEKPSTEYRQEFMNGHRGACANRNSYQDCIYWTKYTNSQGHNLEYCRLFVLLSETHPKDSCVHYRPKEKPFTVQTAEKTSEDIRRLRTTNYGKQPISEIVKNLTAIAESKCINQPGDREASLWNAIDILEDIDEKERSIK